MPRAAPETPGARHMAEVWRETSAELMAVALQETAEPCQDPAVHHARAQKRYEELMAPLQEEMIRWLAGRPPTGVTAAVESGRMITFLDGPAAGIRLRLRTAPETLRVVHEPMSDTWDALDQPGDEPSASEVVYTYRREGEASAVQVNGFGKERWFAIARYRFVVDATP
jgi:hypothetical protein